MAKRERKNTTENQILPLEDALPPDLFLLPIKSRPIFPGIITPLLIPPGKFTNSIEEVLKSNGYIGLVLLKDDKSTKDPVENIFQSGTVAKIFKKVNLPEGGINILTNTIARFQIETILSNSPHLIAKVKYPKEINSANKTTTKALMRSLLILTKELAKNNPLFTEEMKLTLVNMDEPGKMADFVASILNLEKQNYQEIIESTDIQDRLEMVILFLIKEIELISLQKKIQGQISEKIDKQQRQFFLREQLKAIQNELGVGDGKSEKKYDSLLERLKKANVDEQVVEEVAREITKFYTGDMNSAETNVSRNYLDLLNSLPWENPPERKIDLQLTKKILNRDHYKLDDVKDRILESLAVKKLNPNSKGSILCLVGPPGVGKTSIAKSISESLHRKFYRISLGGMRDEAEIKGHRRTYIGSMPGKIIQALRILKEKDPVIILDEIDKLSTGQGDPASALLEVLDPEQNSSFRDHYLDLPFDISRVLFVATANNLDTIPRVLLDRMDVIRLSGYITEEKVEIFRKYLWKKELEKSGLKNKKIQFDTKAIISLINSYSRESGLRGLEKMTNKIVRKIAYKTVTGESFKTTITEKDLKDYLGIPIFTDDRMTTPKLPGTALGLAYTPIGGATLLIEAIFISGKEGLLVTGKLGETMNESATIAYSYIQSLLGDDSLFKDKKIHIHVPDGSTPKDGPSAGITMATAILSLILGKAIRPGYAMTGELTLTGEVLPIGGLREKIIAAKRAGVHKIIYPKDNEPNLSEIPNYIKNRVHFFPVTKYSEIIKILFGEIKIQNKLNKKGK
ncbi:MAG: endopeptidase La [Leptospiraceae bacterium]|nr:endopeptidase La [Leptospiraceae bacterium]NUM41171.1 endopeptidase La [Leptospiraceae bacterium]